MDNRTSSDIQHELYTNRIKLLGAGAVAFAVVLCGAIFYHYVEHLSWLNAFYFTVITLATVGYGDIVPKTDLGKLFTIFYVLVGIGIIGTFANLLIKNTVARRELNKSKRG